MNVFVLFLMCNYNRYEKKHELKIPICQSYNRNVMIVNCNDYIWKSLFFSFRKCWHISLRLYPENSFWGGGLRPTQIRLCIPYITHIALYYCTQFYSCWFHSKLWSLIYVYQIYAVYVQPISWYNIQPNSGPTNVRNTSWALEQCTY